MFNGIVKLSVMVLFLKVFMQTNQIASDFLLTLYLYKNYLGILLSTSPINLPFFDKK